MLKKFSIVLSLVALFAIPSHAEKFAVLGNKVKKTFAFKAEDSLHVTGNHNDLTITGTGQSVRIAGNHNSVSIDGDVDSIELSGNDNDVHVVKKDGRKTPRVLNTGNGNRVK